ncbi:hypothetical protein AAFF_G00224280 [Aldrovandia affinis]|uniref:Aminopeptidase n=1 Tax=Aldrovandia affinis TaxID=143900 RepID=A0AAD7X273_9TELE|nr:hypothetical protein AAFF_G00224280 [Aldrovandia affinis]
MSKSVYVSKAAAVATVAVAALALVAVIGMVIFQHTRIHQCPSPLPPTVLTTTLAPTELPLNMRLPGNLIPESYKIYLQPHLHSQVNNIYDQNDNFTGNCTVKFKCVNSTNTIYIHSKALNLTLIGVTDENGKEMAAHQVQLMEDERDFVLIELVDTLRIDGLYYLSTAFEGECFYNGLAVNSYTSNNMDERYLAYTQMESTNARKVFPCFDEPAMKAVFNITIIHRRGSVALSNMPQKDQVEIDIDGEEWSITEFYPTKKMSTYILSFVVFNFDSKETNYGRYILKTWARPEAIADGHLNYAHSITGNILDFFEEYCGIKYPLSKLDQVALQSFEAMGMENWGLIIYSESILIYNAGSSSTVQKEMSNIVIAHELAHQWFGNLVTMRWWNDLWLKEGFATYTSYLAMDRVEPNGNMKDLIVVREIQPMFDLESEDLEQILVLKEEEVQSPSDIIQLYNTITYSKGAAVLRMIAEFLPERVYAQGLQSYLKAYQYNSVETQDLWSHLQRAVDNSSFHIPVAEVMDTWTQQAGYPLITINTTSGEVSQEHFLLTKNPPEYNRIWQVPIKVMKSGSEQVQFDLITVKGPVSKSVYQCNENEWILANVNLTGYCRVNYNPENWKKLLQQLETDYRKIPTLSRAQLIDDAFKLARIKYVNITLALSTTKYLLNDTEFIPWKTAMKNLEYIIRMFDRSEVYGPMKAYLLKLVGPLYDHFESFTIKSSIPDRHTAQLNQINAVTVACANILPKCQKMATNLFDLWRKDPTTNPIHPNLRPMVYCSAIGAGGEVEWDFAWKMLKVSSSDVERERLVEALACTKQVWILNRYLEYTLDPDKIKPELFSSTIRSIAKNVVGQYLAWDFVISQWSNITQMLRYMGSLEELIAGVTLRFSTKNDLQQLKTFEELHSGKKSFCGILKENPDQHQLDGGKQADCSRVVSKGVEFTLGATSPNPRDYLGVILLLPPDKACEKARQTSWSCGEVSEANPRPHPGLAPLHLHGYGLRRKAILPQAHPPGVSLAATGFCSCVPPPTAHKCGFSACVFAVQDPRLNNSSPTIHEHGFSACV